MTLLELGGGHAPVALTTRSGFAENVHFGAVVGLGSDGSTCFTIGDPAVIVYPRSTMKPLQATAMLEAGLQLSDSELALACASHSGAPEHVAVVTGMLDRVGLTPDVLQNTMDLPYGVDARRAALVAGREPDRITMNCSGKHAAMIATCVSNGWPIDTYLDADHPLQRAITDLVVRFTGFEPSIGVDGCGAPAHTLPLIELARTFRTLALERGPVWRAMTTHPDLVGGQGREVTEVMTSIPGLMAKDGADAVYAAALPDGRAVALKIADGSARAAGPVLFGALQRIGIDVGDVPQRMNIPILGHGEPVGEVRPIVGASV